MTLVKQADENIMHKSLRIIALGLALAILAACSTSEIINIAISKNPKSYVSNYAENRVKSYKYNPMAMASDIKRIRRQYSTLLKVLRGEVEKEWGKGDTLTPTNKRYVKYTQNYKSRAIINFETGLIRVETLAEQSPKVNLQNAIITTLLTPNDPRSVDLYSAKQVKLTGEPYLYGLVRDEQNRLITSPQQAEHYATYLVQNKLLSGKTKQQKTKHFVKFTMVKNHSHIQAQRIKPLVDKYAQQFNVSKSLVYAVIKTESAFNPYAVSSSPAYGLMQIVPTTAGRDTFRKVKGYDHIPSKEYLFNSANNIELGTAYLNILDRQYLGAIQHPLTREYCTISAYNGGAGNVFRMFSQNRDKAVNIINSLSPANVYQKLRHEHPRNETRRYLRKVLDARKEFVSI